MNKVTKVVLIIAFVLIILGGALFAVSLALGGSVRELWDKGILTNEFWESGIIHIRLGDGGDNTFSASGEYRLSADGISSLELNWVAGDVYVELSDGNEIMLTETSKMPITEGNGLVYRVKDGTLTIDFCESKHTPDSFAKELHVLIPAGTAASLDRLDIGSVSSNVMLPELTVTELTFDSVSGNLETGYIDTDTAKLDNISGETEFTGKADILEASVISGDLELRLYACPQKLGAETVSGEVELYLPQDSGWTLHFDTASGEFESDIAFKQTKNGEFIFGNGENEAEICTVSGGLEIGSIETYPNSH